MGKPMSISPKKTTLIFYLLLLVITIGHATSARILNEVDPQPIQADSPNDVVPPIDTTLPSGQIPAVDVSPPVVPDVAPPVIPDVAPPVVPDVAPPVVPDVAPPVVPDVAPPVVPDVSPPVVPDVAPPVVPNVAPPVAADETPPIAADVATGATPVTTSPMVPTSVPAGAANGAEHPQLSFFMHDILGGTHPSGRVVTGIVANSDVNNLPFSKSNNRVFPINGGVPLNTGIINNNNAPFLVGLNGSPTNTIVQNNGNNNVINNNGNSLPFVSAGQLPTGLTLQQLMFGSITVVDNEITEGHELGTAVLGKVQGFYLSSSLDGTSHTLVLTALFHGGGEHGVDDTVSFFGIHRTGSPVSEIAVIGGTGKYEDATGYATIEALPQHDQHTTDGVETITQFNVFITA